MAIQNLQPLTAAQIKHLQRLIRLRNEAQGQVDGFIDYLRLEHGTKKDEGWELRTVEEGFVRECGEPPAG